MEKSNLVAMIIGLLVITLGIYQLINGEILQELFFSFFIGITLFGSAFINYNSNKRTVSNNKCE